MGLQDVVTPLEVEWPTLGRIVHLRIDDDLHGRVLRPAIVLDRGQSPGTLKLRVFAHHLDSTTCLTFAHKSEDGVFFTARFGPEPGEWRWPEIANPPEFFTVDE